MNDALTARQIQILKFIIDEYIEIAEPVGSEALEKKYSLGVSPATVRNEMSSLVKKGFLKQPHTSSGRVPTPKAMKLYVDQLMEEKSMSIAEEVKAKEEVWDSRGNIDKLLEEATHALANHTRSLAVATLDESDKVWHSGYKNVFSNPEFTDSLVCESLFSLIEEVERMNDLFFHKGNPMSPFDLFFGEELGWQNLQPMGVIATRFNIGGKRGALGVIGSTRLSYPRIVPILKYYGSLLEEVAGT